MSNDRLTYAIEFPCRNLALALLALGGFLMWNTFFGLVAATDSHNAGGTPEEDNYFSKVGVADGTAQRRGSVPLDEPGEDGQLQYNDNVFQLWSASGLTAAWAEENTRTSIFDAFKRQEVYATTGPRIYLRFFGGWDFTADEVERQDFADRGYAGFFDAVKIDDAVLECCFRAE